MFLIENNKKYTPVNLTPFFLYKSMSGYTFPMSFCPREQLKVVLDKNCHTEPKVMLKLLVILFELMLNLPVSSYGHVRTLPPLSYVVSKVKICSVGQTSRV